MSIIKYLRDVTGKTSYLDLAKRAIVYAFCDGSVAQTALVHGPRKHGVHVGTDALGNKYYERLTDEQYGRHRWVVYADLGFPNYGATSVTPEWHAWLHYISDEAPSRVPPEVPHFLEAWEPTKTGTEERWLPKGSWNNPERLNWQKVEYWTPPGSG